MLLWLKYPSAPDDNNALSFLLRLFSFGDGAAARSVHPASFSGGRVSPAHLRAQARGRTALREKSPDDSGLRQVTFTFAVIELAAKLAKADGPVVREEFLAFREMFPMPESQSSKVRRLFNAACEENTSVEYYARQIAELFPARKALMRELVSRLFAIAAADGAIQLEEKRLLKKIVNSLGLAHSDYQNMLERYVVKSSSNPYKILGVSSRSGYEEIKRKHRLLVRRYHPDRLTDDNLSRIQLEHAQQQAAMVNAAYDSILRQKGWK